MLRVASNALIVPPFECAWLSLPDYQLTGTFCLQFECKGENDVTIILKPFPGAKRWQHLQRQQGPAGGEQFAVEANYTVILGSHRNSKLKIEKNGDEKAGATGLPGCTVTPGSFISCWISYSNGCIAVGTGPVGSSLSYVWQDPEPPVADIQHIGLSCWDKHVSYRNVQLLPALPQQQLQELRADMQRRTAAQKQQRLLSEALADQAGSQQQEPACVVSLQGASGSAQPSKAVLTAAQASQQLQQQQEVSTCAVPPLLQLVQHAIVAHLQPADVCHMLQLSEALLPRAQHLYEQAVQLAGEWFGLLAQQHLQEIAMWPLDVLMDVVHEPLLDVSELAVFQAVAAWCLAGSLPASAPSHTANTLQDQGPQQQREREQQQQQRAHSDAEKHVTQQGDQQPGAVQLPPHEAAQPLPLQQGHQQHVRDQQPPVQQQQQQPCNATCCRTHDEVLEVMQLVRFALMSEAERQAVLEHPLTAVCPLVEQCMQEDLQRLQDYHSGRPLSSEGGFRCQQRRLVLPAYAAQSPADAQPLGPVAVPACDQDSGQGRDSGECGSSSGGIGAKGGGQLGAAAEGGVSGLQAQGSAGSSLGRVPSGWLSRSGSSSSAKAGSGWRSYRRRLAPSCKELMYVCDGDRHGVIHYIATEYGSKPWVNPVLSKALEIKASSPPSRYTDPKALVSGQFLNTSFAGPRYVRAPPVSTGPAPGPGTTTSSRAAPSTWWQLDLGPQHRLLCNYYVIRHDGSQEGYARSWSLQGSNDLQHWLDLRRHTDDTTIRLPGQYGSWPVAGPAACMPFRAFRLLLTGPTQSQTSPWAFCLSYWELYGYFYKTPELRTAAASGVPAQPALAQPEAQRQQQ